MKRVLVYEHLTGGGMAGEPLQESWLAEGQAMRRAAIAAFRQAGCQVMTFQDTRLPAEYHIESVPIQHKTNLHRALKEWIPQTDHGLLIAPETGGSLAEVVALASQRPGWHLGCQIEAITMCGDKLQTARFFHENDIAHPQTWAMDDADQPWNEFSGYLVIKPRDGAGSLETFKCNSFSGCNLPETDRQKDFIVQKYCEGRSMSLSALCNGRGGFEPVVVFDHNGQWISSDDYIWEFQCQTPIMMPPEFTRRLKNCQQALQTIPGLRGWVGVDFIWNEKSGDDTVIEVNPRLTMSLAWLEQQSGGGGDVARDWLYLMNQSRYV